MTTAGHRGGLSVDQQLALTTAAARLQREFGDVVDTPTIEHLLHISHDQCTADSPILRFLLAERFTRQRLQALTRVLGRRRGGTPTVLFLGARNAGRSQMALGFFQHLAEDRAVGWSGGTQPSDEISLAVVAAMRERGIDISREFPKPWTGEIVQAADVVITMGSDNSCPVLPGKHYLDWDLDDPINLDVEDIRPVREGIERHVRNLLDQLNVPART
jgi:protein-tyrosine-phosphatase